MKLDCRNISELDRLVVTALGLARSTHSVKSFFENHVVEHLIELV
jgi:hypothetical protein